MKKIQLTQGKVATVDDEDFEWLNQWKWCATCHKNNSNNFYAIRAENGTNVLMHRVILKTAQYVDHINGNTLDNRKENLRPCNPSQNIANSKISKNNKSGYKGVYKARNKWRANIMIAGKTIHLGTWETAEMAAMAYDKKAKEVFGEFAKTNF